MKGLLLLDKPSGITSFGAVARIKRLTHEKRVGHTGTLDPMATGILPIFIGRATVLSSYLLDADKKYTACARLGISTDTLDITGKITEEKDVKTDNSELISVLKGFTGKQMQTPPIFSALKKNGVRLYSLARKGKEVEIPPREVEIYEINQKKALDSDNEFSFETTVSKGTYIRSLVRDIGVKLGTGAVLTELRRTETSGFSVENCVSLDVLTEENIEDYIIPADKAVEHLSAVFVTEKQAIRFQNGGQLDLDRLRLSGTDNGKIYRVYSNDEFLGLGFIKADSNQLAVKCLV